MYYSDAVVARGGKLVVQATLAGFSFPDPDRIPPSVRSRVKRSTIGVPVRLEAPVLTRARQARAVGVALAEVRSFAKALREGMGPEIASAHLKPAESALEELVGVITPDDVLDRVFAEFCVGK